MEEEPEYSRVMVVINELTPVLDRLREQGLPAASRMVAMFVILARKAITSGWSKVEFLAFAESVFNRITMEEKVKDNVEQQANN